MSRASPRNMEVRFDEKWIPEPNTGCWLWFGCLGGPDGRPQIGLADGTKTIEFAYRIAWKRWRGPIPQGMEVCHSCDMPACVNPDHLFLGTHAENMADMARKGRGHGPCQDRQSARYITKLTAVDVLAIWASPKGQYELADDYGVRQPAISSIILRKTWKHLP